MTNKESQTVEYKQSWRDDCLKVISAFANSDGGKLIIELDDQGEPSGLKNVKRQLEDIPNTIRNKLGIIPSVEQKKKNEKDISRITATRDLIHLVGKDILKMVGIGKRQVHYILNDSKKMQ